MTHTLWANDDYTVLLRRIYAPNRGYFDLTKAGKKPIPLPGGVLCDLQALFEFREVKNK
jgi:hypothetical protein